MMNIIAFDINDLQYNTKTMLEMIINQILYKNQERIIHYINTKRAYLLNNGFMSDIEINEKILKELAPTKLHITFREKPELTEEQKINLIKKSNLFGFKKFNELEAYAIEYYTSLLKTLIEHNIKVSRHL